MDIFQISKIIDSQPSCNDAINTNYTIQEPLVIIGQCQLAQAINKQTYVNFYPAINLDLIYKPFKYINIIPYH